ncbi:MAG: beta-ketoacyl synthase N-terminal-like domain-containing protein [Desulfosarcinaceae bacterium]|nr:beta-ketoacyl synthase N-terminal-like domain-containing protein [Desulfosarcinaceae bacterium]
MERRVVITGAAAITPIGNNRETILANLTQGVSGVEPLKSDGLLTGHIHSKVFGTVGEPIDYAFKRRDRKTMGPVAYYACETARRAIAAAGLEPAFIQSGRMGAAFGSTHGSPTVQRGIYRTFFSETDARLTSIGAVDYLKSMVHTTAVNITKMFGITGRVISSSTACTTSSQSIGFGYEAIKFGLQDAMLCGGADEYDTTTVAVFDNLLACSTAYNETPERTPRPFDRDRDGLVVGEGAGALVLEALEGAQKRGAHILGEVIGFSCMNNGGDLILPNKEGIARTIRSGLACARLTPEQVDFISAHATATKTGDVMEAQAIGEIYGTGPAVTGLKSYMGHTMGSCGAIETILTLYLMRSGIVVPTLNLENIDERCAMIRHPEAVSEMPIRIAAIQNFAFGGVNTCLFIRRFVR